MWDLSTKDRLHEWKLLRLTIDKMEVNEALNEIVKVWSFVPFVNYYLDPDNYSEWPDPWELLDENTYCNVARGLGMFYTLYFSEQVYKYDSLEFWIVRNEDEKIYTGVVAINDGQFILNYQFNEIVNTMLTQHNMTVIKKITAQDLNLEQRK